MNYSSLKEKGKDMLSDTCETVKYGFKHPLSFTYDTLFGLALIAEEMIEGKKTTMNRVCDDHRKNCAKLTFTGFVAVGVLCACIGGCKHNGENKQIQQAVQQAVQLERE